MLFKGDVRKIIKSGGLRYFFTLLLALLLAKMQLEKSLENYKLNLITSKKSIILLLVNIQNLKKGFSDITIFLIFFNFFYYECKHYLGNKEFSVNFLLELFCIVM